MAALAAMGLSLAAMGLSTRGFLTAGLRFFTFIIALACDIYIAIALILPGPALQHHLVPSALIRGRVTIPRTLRHRYFLAVFSWRYLGGKRSEAGNQTETGNLAEIHFHGPNLLNKTHTYQDVTPFINICLEGC